MHNIELVCPKSIQPAHIVSTEVDDLVQLIHRSFGDRGFDSFMVFLQNGDNFRYGFGRLIGKKREVNRAFRSLLKEQFLIRQNECELPCAPGLRVKGECRLYSPGKI